MKMAMDLLFFAIWAYYCYSFVHLLLKMKQKAMIPSEEADFAQIRTLPQKAVAPSVYSKQKTGIIFQCVTLIFILLMLMLYNGFDALFYLMLYFILARSHDLFNMFAVLQDGMIIGDRFFAWRKIKSFEFVPIDVNHRFYGYASEVNSGYELKLKQRFFSKSLIVTSDEMKERLTAILSEHMKTSLPNE